MSTEIAVTSFEVILQTAINTEVKRAIDQVISKAQAELVEKLKASADKIALSVCSIYEIQRMNNVITIRVIKGEN